MVSTANYLFWPAVLLFAAGILCFYPFTAEDALIYYRYAENLINNGALVYNEGEPINAMTSPFQAWLSAALFLLVGETVVSNKVVAFAALLASAALLWRHFRGRKEAQLLVFPLLLLPSCVLIWTFGGLETPFLLLLVTATIIFVDARVSTKETIGLQTLTAVFLLAGGGFLVRYDSAPFFVPVVLYAASRARALGAIAIAAIAGAALPVAWLAVSHFYYGDILPTSYYVKHPTVSLGYALKNASYIALNLVYAGVLPILLLALTSRRAEASAQSGAKKPMWWLYLAMAFEMLYGLTMATKHMMFSFRFFVPYLPAAAVLVAMLINRAASAAASSPDRGAAFAKKYSVVMSLLMIFQGFHMYYVYDRSVNGLSVVGEYAELSARDYMSFMDTLRKESEEIQEHWREHGSHGNRPARVYTYAGGMLPYNLQGAYIYEQLVSFRHDNSWRNSRRSADYIHMISPRHGSVEDQLPKPINHYSLVSSYQLDFDGATQSFLVYHDPNPDPHTLKPYIGER